MSNPLSIAEAEAPAQPASEPSSLEANLLPQRILLAATNHDIPLLRSLLRAGRATLPNPAAVQDPETRTTPLHAAIAACELDDIAVSNGTNGTPQATSGGGLGVNAAEEEEARTTVRFLLGEGAIWNDLNADDETPGCVAWRLRMSTVYECLVDAGVRAELLLNRMGEYQALGGGSDDEEAAQMLEGEDAGVEVAVDEAVEVERPDVNSRDYLSSGLTFSADRILDSDRNGVMMEWERGIMKRSAELLLPGPGLRVLNVGFGMGIIDGFFQGHAPSTHHIIEAHPAVLSRMTESGWREKEGVEVHEGRWQDVVPELLAEGVMFDAIYFDTFAEDYKDLREFFSESVIGLLDGDGRFGFFNGLGADRQVCYDVYTKVVEMDLFEAGFDTEWDDVKVPDLETEKEWEGVRRRYWAVDKHRLPTCRFIS